MATKNARPAFSSASACGSRGERRTDCECTLDCDVYSVCGRCSEEPRGLDDDGYDPFAELERLEEEAEARA